MNSLCISEVTTYATYVKGNRFAFAEDRLKTLQKTIAITRVTIQCTNGESTIRCIGDNCQILTKVYQTIRSRELLEMKNNISFGTTTNTFHSLLKKKVASYLIAFGLEVLLPPLTAKQSVDGNHKIMEHNLQISHRYNVMEHVPIITQLTKITDWTRAQAGVWLRSLRAQESIPALNKIC